MLRCRGHHPRGIHHSQGKTSALRRLVREKRDVEYDAEERMLSPSAESAGVTGRASDPMDRLASGNQSGVRKRRIDGATVWCN